ncbi:MAG: hypothetical protein ACPG5B_14545 [Chitinophagales bacterium]
MKQYINIFISFFSLLLLFQTACEDALQQECTTTNITSEAFAYLSNSFGIVEADIWGDCLMLKVSYSGGCEKHIFTAYSEGAILESMPLGANIVVHHNNPEDPCDGIISEIITFDLSVLQVPNDNTTIIHIANSSLSLNYTY